jgi:hypothetical protein
MQNFVVGVYQTFYIFQQKFDVKEWFHKAKGNPCK